MHNAHIRQRRALAAARLQHPQFFALNGEFKILHISEALLKRLANFHKLREGGRHVFILRHLIHWKRRTNARHNVLALRVDQVFAVENILARGWIARERDTSSGIIASISKHHGLHIHRGAPLRGNFIFSAVHNGAIVHPTAENRGDGANQLIHWIIGKFLAGAIKNERLEALHQFMQVRLGELCVLLHGKLALECGHDIFKWIVLIFIALLHAHHHVAIHLDEAAIAIPCEAAVVGGFLQRQNSFVIQSQIQNGVHHAGHAVARAGPNRHEQRIARVAKFFTNRFFQARNIGLQFLQERWRHLAAIGVIQVAHVGGDGETRRHGQANRAHGRQVRALAAQQCLHVGASFGALGREEINQLASFDGARF